MDPKFEIETEDDLHTAYARLFALLEGEPDSPAQREAVRLLEIVANYQKLEEISYLLRYELTGI